MTPRFIPVEDLGHSIRLARSPTALKLKYERLVQEEYSDENWGKLSDFVRSLLLEKQQEWGISSAEAETIEARVLLYRTKLVEYEQGLTNAIQKQYPISAKFQAKLTEFQKYFKLRDEDIAEIHRRVLPPAPQTQSNLAPTLPSAPIPNPAVIGLDEIAFDFDCSHDNLSGQLKLDLSDLDLSDLDLSDLDLSDLDLSDLDLLAPIPKPAVVIEPLSSTQTTIPLSTFSFETAPGSAQYFVEELGNGVKLEMVYVPRGQFMMGSDESNKEKPQHSVDVSSFLMSKYPVSQAQYESIIGSNPSHFKGSQRPVELVSWDDTQAFCQKLTNQTDKPYRLPSEAEWEYACRAGSKTPFYFGETISPDVVNYDVSRPYGHAPKGVHRKTTTDVGCFPPNSFGLYDLHGNVGEWCQDTWHANYQGAPIDDSPWVSSDKNYRVLRGGSWNGNAWNCRSANRLRHTPDYRNSGLGFRLALPCSPGVS
jgi:formylglycine-generating enzyme required for sulfatase activity